MIILYRRVAVGQSTSTARTQHSASDDGVSVEQDATTDGLRTAAIVSAQDAMRNAQLLSAGATAEC